MSYIYENVTLDSGHEKERTINYSLFQIIALNIQN